MTQSRVGGRRSATAALTAAVLAAGMSVGVSGTAVAAPEGTDSPAPEQQTDQAPQPTETPTEDPVEEGGGGEQDADDSSPAPQPTSTVSPFSGLSTESPWDQEDEDDEDPADGSTSFTSPGATSSPEAGQGPSGTETGTPDSDGQPDRTEDTPTPSPDDAPVPAETEQPFPPAPEDTAAPQTPGTGGGIVPDQDRPSGYGGDGTDGGSGVPAPWQQSPRGGADAGPGADSGSETSTLTCSAQSSPMLSPGDRASIALVTSSPEAKVTFSDGSTSKTTIQRVAAVLSDGGEGAPTLSLEVPRHVAQTADDSVQIHVSDGDSTATCHASFTVLSGGEEPSGDELHPVGGLPGDAEDDRRPGSEDDEPDGGETTEGQTEAGDSASSQSPSAEASPSDSDSPQAQSPDEEIAETGTPNVIIALLVLTVMLLGIGALVVARRQRLQ